MFDVVETQPEVNVQESEYKRLLGLPQDRELEGRVQELALWAQDWYRRNGEPWIYARQTGKIESSQRTLRIDGIPFSPGRLHERFVQSKADSAMLVAVSAGKDCEETARELWSEGKPDEYFFLEVFGSAVVEHLVAAASFRLCEWADQHGAAVLPHYSPGYPGWDIKEQGDLLNLIMRGDGTKIRERIGVLDTGMLRPKKSLLAVFGITHRVDLVPRLTDLIPCESCSLASCRYRRIPQKYQLPQIEAVRAASGRESF
jgi:hypothetical protein